LFEQWNTLSFARHKNEPRLIDNNAFSDELVSKQLKRIDKEKRLRETDDHDAQQKDGDIEVGFVEGLNPGRVSDLVSPDDDFDLINGENGQTSGSDDERDPSQVWAENINRAMEAAKQEADRIKGEALSNAVMIKKTARDEGYRDGYAAAEKRATDAEAKFKKLSADLENEYNKRFQDMETNLIDQLTDIYSYVFSVDFANRKAFIPQMLANVIRKNSGSRNIIIHVSDDDVDDVRQNLDTLQGASGNHVRLDVFADASLEKSQCYLETYRGIIDRGLDTQLRELETAIKLLARDA